MSHASAMEPSYPPRAEHGWSRGDAAECHLDAVWDRVKDLKCPKPDAGLGAWNRPPDRPRPGQRPLSGRRAHNGETHHVHFRFRPAPCPLGGDRTRRRTSELAAALALLGSSNLLVNRVLPGWTYPLVNGATALLLLGMARRAGLGAEALGLERRHLWRSAAVGAAGMAIVAVGYGVALAVPSLRHVFDDGRLGDIGTAGLLWNALVRIPVGTVLLEEVAFRGVLPALFGADARWRWGPILAASSLFGAWHILPSLALHRNAAVAATLGTASAAVIPTLAVVASTAAGVLLYWWRHTGRGLLAPALVHLATNSGGVLIAWFFLGKG